MMHNNASQIPFCFPEIIEDILLHILCVLTLSFDQRWFFFFYHFLFSDNSVSDATGSDSAMS
jgi:hypothetical protein